MPVFLTVCSESVLFCARGNAPNMIFPPGAPSERGARCVGSLFSAVKCSAQVPERAELRVELENSV